MKLVDALKNAVERHEFLMLYQPIFDLRTKKMVSMEALIRWTHPTLGNIPPEKFIPLAEQAGLITPIGTWALKTIGAQIKKWQFRQHPHLTIGINISPLQLIQPNFLSLIEMLLKESDLPPNQLIIEITETAMLPDLQNILQSHHAETLLDFHVSIAERVLNEIRKKGIQIAVDDFGTGYASLVYLSRLPVSIFKMDKSFIQGINQRPHDEIIVNFLLTLGKTLGFDVIAEGIETEQQLDFLLQNHCELGQGFLLSKPLKSEEMSAYLRTHYATNNKN